MLLSYKGSASLVKYVVYSDFVAKRIVLTAATLLELFIFVVDWCSEVWSGLFRASQFSQSEFCTSVEPNLVNIDTTMIWKYIYWL